MYCTTFRRGNQSGLQLFWDKKTVEKKPKAKINYKALVGLGIVSLVALIAWLRLPSSENRENDEST